MVLAPPIRFLDYLIPQPRCEHIIALHRPNYENIKMDTRDNYKTMKRDASTPRTTRSVAVVAVATAAAVMLLPEPVAKKQIISKFPACIERNHGETHLLHQHCSELSLAKLVCKLSSLLHGMVIRVQLSCSLLRLLRRELCLGRQVHVCLRLRLSLSLSLS